MLSEKELNVNLLDELDLIERLEMADNEGGYEKTGKLKRDFPLQLSGFIVSAL